MILQPSEDFPASFLRELLRSKYRPICCKESNEYIKVGLRLETRKRTYSTSGYDQWISG